MADTPVTIENLLDKIADGIISDGNIKSTLGDDFLKDNQRTIRNGLISIGRSNSERLVLYQSDVQANKEDLSSKNQNLDTFESIVKQYQDAGITLEQIIPSIDGSQNPIQIDIPVTNGIGPFSLTNILSGTDENGNINPINVGQFLTIDKLAANINQQQANEFLDTNIYELLPDVQLRQERIDNAIAELKNLLPPQITDEEWGISDNGVVTRDNDDNWVGSEQYYLDNTTSAPQDNVPNAGEEEEGFITRLSDNTSSQNDNKSIEDLRDLLSTYLKDIDEPDIELQDDREVYRNESDGYLKFRNLNQGIIVRNTGKDFIEGLNPDTKEYLETGFTITMWVRFLDKTSEGTLFNFGNPLRQEMNNEKPFGFKLETFVLNSDSPTDLVGNPTFDTVDGFTPVTTDRNPNGILFENTDTERFIRLIVYDDDVGKTYDSHTASPHIRKQSFLPIVGNFSGSDSLSIFTNTRVPMDFDEWYFICATFNPDIDEDNSFQYQDNGVTTGQRHKFWSNYFDPTIFFDVELGEASWIGSEEIVDFPFGFQVNPSEWSTLLTQENINTLDMTDYPKNENGFVDAFIDFDYEYVNGSLGEQPMYIRNVEITSTTDLSGNAENKQGFRKTIPDSVVNGGAGYHKDSNGNPQSDIVNQVRGLRIGDESDGGNLRYMSTEDPNQEGGNQVTIYENLYDFNRIQIGRSTPDLGTDVNGDQITWENLNSGDVFKITNFRVRYIAQEAEEGTGVSVVNSNLGNKCKVEIISRSDLLRARGFKVD